MKRITILLLCFGLAYDIAAQTPDTKEMEHQMKEMEAQMKEMKVQMKEMEKQMREMELRQPRVIIPDIEMPPMPPFPDDSTRRRRKVIILNGERLQIDSLPMDMSDLYDLEELEELSDYYNYNYNYKFDDSLLRDEAMRIYENDDSIVIRVGDLKLKVDEDENNRIIERNIIINNNEDDKKKKDKTIEGTALGLKLGLNNYLSDGQFKTPAGYAPLELSTGKSINVNLGIAGIRWNIKRNYVTMHTGIALDFLNYRFSSDAVLVPKVDSVAFMLMSDNPNISKNKLAATYLEVPLRIQFQTHKKDEKAFRFSIGGRVGYLIGSHTKVVVNDDKIKQRDDFNLTTLKYGLLAQIGFSYLNFYVNYDFTPVFQDGVQPELMPVAAGIVLTGW